MYIFLNAPKSIHVMCFGLKFIDINPYRQMSKVYFYKDIKKVLFLSIMECPVYV
jgi:hypothetical protein